MVAVIPLQRRFDGDVLALADEGDRRVVERCPVAVVVVDERGDATLVEELDVDLLDAAGIVEEDADAGIEEGELAQPVLERGEVELEIVEGVGRGCEGHLGPGLAAGVANDGERRLGLTLGEAHHMFLAVAPDAQFEPRRQRVDDRHPDPVQPA